jgi:nucleotide-binding universal stress UspA family protein
VVGDEGPGAPRDLIADELKAAGVRVTATTAAVSMGRVGVEIARLADRDDVGLIVMAPTARPTWQSITLGSTSHRVVHLAYRPILLVPAD